ncbi:MAG: hypothetical protein WD032_08610 [Nitrospirales bacterium]
MQFTSLQDYFTPEKLTAFLRELGGAGFIALMDFLTVAVVGSAIPGLPLD